MAKQGRPTFYAYKARSVECTDSLTTNSEEIMVLERENPPRRILEKKCFGFRTWFFSEIAFRKSFISYIYVSKMFYLKSVVKLSAITLLSAFRAIKS